MLTPEGCRARQRRLLTKLEADRCDPFVTSNYRTAYYFTGLLGPADAPVIFTAWQAGSSALVTSVQGQAVADEILPFETYSAQRCITMPAHDAAARFAEYLSHHAARRVSRCAVERAVVSGLLEETLRTAFPSAGLLDAAALTLALRKRKEEDEIDAIKESLKYCAIAYSAAREVIAPGRTEIDVYSAMHNAVIRAAGTFIAFPGDFACGMRAIKEGGAPTRREIEPNDLYILDLFPAPALYAGDTCRTFAASPPTDGQYRAWEVVSQAVRLGESMIKPGVPAREVHRALKEFLDAYEPAKKSFWHHAGHGIGLHGHEAPRMIPASDDIFEVGDVIAMEPGIYSEDLHGGIRLEDNYVVRENGLENLFKFSKDL